MGEAKPSAIIHAVLSGKMNLHDAPKAIQSACSFHIYQGAAAVLEGKTKADRQRRLAKIPAKVRPHVEAEALRLFRVRHFVAGTAKI